MARATRSRRIASAVAAALTVLLLTSACGDTGATEGKKRAEEARRTVVTQLWKTYYGGFKGRFLDLGTTGRFVACGSEDDPKGVVYAAYFDYEAMHKGQSMTSFADDVNRSLNRTGWKTHKASNSHSKLANGITGYVRYFKGGPGGNLAFVSRCIDTGKATSGILARYGDDNSERLEPSTSTPSPVPTGFSPQP